MRSEACAREEQRVSLLRISSDTTLQFGSPAGIVFAGESAKDFNFAAMPPGTILLTLPSSKMECALGGIHGSDTTSPVEDCYARRLSLVPTTKVQGRTLERVALELRGTRTV